MEVLRSATSADIELTYQIKKLSIKPYVEKVWGWNEEVQYNFHLKEFNPGEIRIITGKNGEEIGLLCVVEDENCLYIKSILIVSNAQGRGTGTEILTKLIEQAKLTSRRIELQVLKVNIRAKRLYEVLGFGVITQTELHYQMAITHL